MRKTLARALVWQSQPQADFEAARGPRTAWDVPATRVATLRPTSSGPTGPTSECYFMALRNAPRWLWDKPLGYWLLWHTVVPAATPRFHTVASWAAMTSANRDCGCSAMAWAMPPKPSRPMGRRPL